MVEAKKWRELHETTASRLEYGVWHKAALAVLEKEKEEVKDRSFQLGISLRFVFEELEANVVFDFFVGIYRRQSSIERWSPALLPYLLWSKDVKGRSNLNSEIFL